MLTSNWGSLRSSAIGSVHSQLVSSLSTIIEKNGPGFTIALLSLCPKNGVKSKCIAGFFFIQNLDVVIYQRCLKCRCIAKVIPVNCFCNQLRICTCSHIFFINVISWIQRAISCKHSKQYNFGRQALSRRDCSRELMPLLL